MEGCGVLLEFLGSAFGSHEESSYCTCMSFTARH